MKTLLKLGLAILVIAGSVLSSEALSITPSSTPVWTGTNNSNLSETEISAIVGVNVTLLYTHNEGNNEEGGSFQGSYDTTYDNEPNDPEDALIEYISGPSINSNRIFLYVKDGNQDPAFYIFDISTWNGTDDIDITGFWPNQGAISHVSILGGGGSRDERLPDGGLTVALLGLGFAGMGVSRRFIKR